MADSPMKDMGQGYLSVLILVAGAEIPKTYQVDVIEIVKEVNKIPYARIEIVDGNAREQTFPGSEDTKFDPGKEIEIKAGYGAGNEATIFKGVIIEHGLKHAFYENKIAKLVIKCRDKALKMTVGRKNKIYLEQKDSDIISALASDSGLSATTDATKVTHKKLIQYYSTNWDFMLTRADVNGLIVTIDDGKVNVKKPTVSEKSAIKLSYGMDVLEMDMFMDATYQLSEVKADHWDPAKQAIETTNGAKPSVNAQGDMDSAKLSKVTEPKELLQTAPPITKDALQAWADSVYLRGHLSRIRGTISFHGTSKPLFGKTVELFGFGKHFTGDAYVSRVRHLIRKKSWETEVGLGLPMKPYMEEHQPSVGSLPAAGMLPPIYGLQHGVVKQIHEDPDGEFRVLINIPIIDGGAGDGVWARMAHYYATADSGFVFYPEVGDEVLLGFLNNDPSFPVIVGSMYSSKIKLSSEHTPDDKNTFKAISVSKGKMKVEFDTSDGKEVITIITPTKNKIVMSDADKMITIEDPNNKNKMVFDSAGILLEAEKDIVLKSKTAGIAMEAMKDIAMKATANIKAEATANVEIKATAQAKMEGTAGIELKSAAMAKLEGSAMCEVKGGLLKLN